MADTDDAGNDELGEAVDDAVEPVVHESIMKTWESVVMQSVESVRPPRDDDDPLRRLYDERPEDDPPS